MAMNERGLLDLRERINQAEINSAESRGLLKHLQKELINRYGCKTIEDAEKKLKELKAQEEEMQNQIDDELEKIEEKYDVPN